MTSKKLTSLHPYIRVSIIIVILLFILWAFFHINKSNYNKYAEAKNNLIEHPEYLPTSESAKISAFGFQNLRADLYWMQAIQYIGGNALSSGYKKYLFAILNLVTDLNPYFEHPYIIGQLLLPNYNERYENLTDKEQKTYIDQAEALWLKWIENFCDLQKVKKVANEEDLQKVWTYPSLKNPCKTYSIAYYLAYVYFFHKNDPINASKYYKIASANDDSLEGAKVLAAIMQWKWWNREKSYFMFLNIAKNLESEDTACIGYANELENIWAGIFIAKQVPLDARIIQAVEQSRNQVIWNFDIDENEHLLSDTECSGYVNKATRELNLAYIEAWNKNFEKDNNGLPARHAKALYTEWYIDFLPTDFQQYEDHGIIYEYNYDTKNYDYSIWSYD